MKALKLGTLLLLLLAMPLWAHASAALLLEQPFGTFGYLNPTGHAAIYLSDVCAETPMQLRRCQPGEAGVVISRYHRVAGYDWLAMPLVAYLYAVDTIDEIPSDVTPTREAELRDVYRRKHLLDLVPDAAGGMTPDGEWIQLMGASYDRKIFVYQIDTPPERDEALIAAMNARSNKSHFNLFFNNCADLSRTILNFYYPHSVRRNFTVDAGLTTPKQLARSLTQYAKRHESLDFQAYILPQVTGSISRSRPVRGVVESFLKTKYVVPLAVFQPTIAVGLVADYLVRGRFDPARNAVTLQDPADLKVLYADTKTTTIPPAMTPSESADEAAPDAADTTARAVSNGTE